MEEEFDDGGVRELDNYFEGTKLAFVNYIHPRAIVQKGFKKMALAIIPGVKPSKYKGNLSANENSAIENTSKGTSNIVERASGAEKGITKETYKDLRKKTPSPEIRKNVNPDGPKFDPVYGYEVNKFEADHIVSMKNITEMDGFNQLTRKQQIEVLNLKENFTGLGKSTNSSKGSHGWTNWVGHSKLEEIPPEVRGKMLKLEENSVEALKKAIEERLK